MARPTNKAIVMKVYHDGEATPVTIILPNAVQDIDNIRFEDKIKR